MSNEFQYGVYREMFAGSLRDELEKRAADMSVIRRAARKLVFGNKRLRQRVRDVSEWMPRQGSKTHREIEDALRAELAQAKSLTGGGRDKAIAEARTNLGNHQFGHGAAGFDSEDGKIIFEGFRQASPEVRATGALHELNEFLEARRYARQGFDLDDLEATYGVLGKRMSHMNAVLPVRDLNIARTATGKNADKVRETLENMRALELHDMSTKMPSLAPMLKQLEGRGIVYGSRGPSKSVLRAQSILDSGKGSRALRTRAQKIVDTYTAGQKPNVRLNRREINQVRDTFDTMFPPLDLAVRGFRRG